MLDKWPEEKHYDQVWTCFTNELHKLDHTFIPRKLSLWSMFWLGHDTLFSFYGYISFTSKVTLKYLSSLSFTHTQIQHEI